MRSFVDPLGFKYSSLHHTEGTNPGTETETSGVVMRLEEQRGRCGVGRELMSRLLMGKHVSQQVMQARLLFAGVSVEESVNHYNCVSLVLPGDLRGWMDIWV